MTIHIIDKVGFSETAVLKLAMSLLKNREPQGGTFDYRLESHGGCMGNDSGITLPYPIIVKQSNKRVSERSPIEIIIKRNDLEL
jgi:hypothetical protein